MSIIFSTIISDTRKMAERKVELKIMRKFSERSIISKVKLITEGDNEYKIKETYLAQFYS